MAEKDVKQGQSDTCGVDEKLVRHGGLSYLEIPTADAQRSACFYEVVFGWSLQDRDTDDPRFEDATGHLIGRWVMGRVISREPGLLPYIYVNDIHAAVERVRVHAGEVVRSIFSEGNLWVATVRDPDGNPLGLWQEAPR
jgi:predicted enzyme related to lactoylglutathione lyase